MIHRRISSTHSPKAMRLRSCAADPIVDVSQKKRRNISERCELVLHSAQRHYRNYIVAAKPHMQLMNRFPFRSLSPQFASNKCHWKTTPTVSIFFAICVHTFARVCVSVYAFGISFTGTFIRLFHSTSTQQQDQTKKKIVTQSQCSASAVYSQSRNIPENILDQHPASTGHAIQPL